MKIEKEKSYKLNFRQGFKKQQQNININKDVIENRIKDFIMYIKLYLYLLLLFKATIKYLPASR